MKMPNKMMIAVGAIALTATTLLTGCGSKSTEATPAAEPASAAVPMTITEGMVKPADVSDENWQLTLEGYEETFAKLTPEQLAAGCNEDPAPASEERIQKLVDLMGGTAEEWATAMNRAAGNLVLLSCAAAE